MVDRSRRPLSSPDQTPEAMRLAIIEARRRHPSRGAKKLLKLLQRKDSQAVWPSRWTICEVLKREGLVRQKTRRRKVGHPGKPTSIVAARNELWCVDFKGEFATRDGRYCYPLTVTDSYSRYLLGWQGQLSNETLGAKETFEGLYKRYGLPARIGSDNGTPFASTALGRLSQLSVWWIRLGIRPELIEPGKPQRNGQHEPMHRTLKAETTRPPGANLVQQQRLFNRFRREYNEVRPHEGIELKTPATLYEASARHLPKEVPELVYLAHFETRLVSKNSGIRWNSRWVAVRHTCAGLYVGLEQVDHEL